MNKPKPVVELDKDGNIIGRWPSVKQCGADNDIHHYLIAYYCKTAKNMKNGRIFRYEGENTGEVDDIPDYPCITCRRFSKYGNTPFGYCMRKRKQVYKLSTCGEHEYPKNGKFIK